VGGGTAGAPPRPRAGPEGWSDRGDHSRTRGGFPAGSRARGRARLVTR
jgi:hypothetical protein